ncbi:MAG: metal-dependent transcriptional regulator [Burkholderiales bacterium]|nr:metal-dependent transcriptional regulator [Anaerolineae bacterium]
MAGSPNPTIREELLSPTTREYLAQIYRLSDRVGGSDSAEAYVSTSALADLLDVSAPAVNRMVTKLREMGLLLHEPYRGISLTEPGEREALKELRRHRIAEAFLVTVMGFQWHEIHEEAERMSRALGETVAERMAQMAGYPQFCPHGEPIPNADGTLAQLNDVLLADVKTEQELEITRVRTRDSDRLQYLAALGLTPGTHISLLHAAPFHGPLQLKVGSEYRIIGHNLAELIRVKPIQL